MLIWKVPCKKFSLSHGLVCVFIRTNNRTLVCFVYIWRGYEITDTESFYDYTCLNCIKGFATLKGMGLKYAVDPAIYKLD